MRFEEYLNELIQHRDDPPELRMGAQRYAQFAARMRYEKQKFGFNIVPDMAVGADMIRVLPHLYCGGEPEDFLAPFHRHNCYEMVYVYRGRYRTTFPGQTPIVLEQGDVILLNSRILHNVEMLSPDTIYFDILLSRRLIGSGLLALLSDNSLFAYFFKYDIYSKKVGPEYLFFRAQESNAALVERLVCRLVEESVNHAPSRSGAMQALLILLLAELSRVDAKVQPMPEVSPESKLCDVLSFMTEHCRDITLEELAEQFHYSKTHMSKWIAKTAGRNFRDLLRDIRLEQAAWKLEHTEMAIEDIGAAVGLHDYANFQRLFKERYDISPRAWRQEHAH